MVADMAHKNNKLNCIAGHTYFTVAVRRAKHIGNY
jgi:hypothetical protein